MINVNNHYIADEIPSIITELRRQLELNGVKRFYKITDTPNNTMVCCPFHKEGQERKPSMGILKSDGTCHCFSCGWVGSLQEMVSNCFGYNDFGKYGEKWLLKNFLAMEIENRKDIELDYERARKNSNCGSSNNPNSKLHYVCEEELDTYRYYHPYWKKRGITDERLIELFDLGYDKESRCITFPVRDVQGKTLFVARRSVDTKYFNYPSGAEKPLYGLYEIWLGYCWTGTEWDGEKQQLYYSRILFPTEVIVCESMLDALTCWQYGKPAVALNGLGTNEQFKQLREMPCRKFIIATDNDEAGMKARQRIARNVKNKILTQYIIPEGKKDINDLSREEFLSLDEIFL